MDAQRGIIFIGLAIVSYLMILEWNKDYGTPVQEPVAVTQTLAPELSAPDTSTVTSDEFTTPEQQVQQAGGIQSATTSGSAGNITVNTDVLNVTINLEGGNVIGSTLPVYKKSLGSQEALPLLQLDSAHHYTAESGLFGRDGFDSSKNGSTPVYSTTEKQFSLSADQNNLNVDLVFTSEQGIKITKRYTFERGSYLIKVSYLIDNQSTKTWEGNLQAKITRDQSADPSSQTSMGMKSFLGMVLSTPNEPYEKFDFKELQEAPINQTVQGGWVAFIQHYFLSAWIPDANTTHTYQTRVKNGLHLMGFISTATTVEPGMQGEVSAKLYLGPKLLDQLEAAAPKLDLTVDYGWLFFIAYPLFLLLDFLFGIVGNWGIAIILVTVIVKALFFHLSATSYRSMANMRRVAPELQRMKETYGDDRQKMSQAMMDLYRKEKINPLGGCLPILVQMPVFIALYWVLMESVQLRHAPFFFWITDLSVKDPYFLLPILMGATMFIQMSLNPAPPDPVQARVMKLMPVIFTVFFLWFPSGLVLYWLVNNVLSIAQQWVITRQIEQAGSKA